MQIKKCSKCKKIKLLSEFYKNKFRLDRYSDWCKKCNNKYSKKYYQKNKEYLKKCFKEYRKNNLEIVREIQKKWNENNPKRKKELHKKWRLNNSEKLSKWGKIWRVRNPEKIRQYAIDWIKDNIKNKLNKNIKTAIWFSLDRNKNNRHWEDLVGYTLQDLMIHLENLFEEEMSWDNYGRKGWSIDHKIPISFFQFNSYNDWEFKYCWSLNNLQPLWHKENLRKHNKIIKE